jgi:hypothetical protein
MVSPWAGSRLTNVCKRVDRQMGQLRGLERRKPHVVSETVWVGDVPLGVVNHGAAGSSPSR